MSIVDTPCFLFLSTPSVGRATARAPETERAISISIHALRGEGDLISISTTPLVLVFLSTPSVGRATTDAGCEPNGQIFLSTPSVGRATYTVDAETGEIKISIHALRGEGDAHNLFLACVPHTFLSTPSVGRATHRLAMLYYFGTISIHALRGEGDLQQRLLPTWQP